MKRTVFRARVAILGSALLCTSLVYLLRGRSISTEPQTQLNIFTATSWEAAHEDIRKEAANRCISVNHNPSFTMCVYNPEKDEYISKTFVDGGFFEWDLAAKLQHATSLYQKEGVDFIDGGAQLGTHSLAMASKGYRVWSIEPQIQNAAKIHLSATMSGFRDRLTIVNNALSETYGKTMYLGIHPTNNGGSALHSDNSGDDEMVYQPVTTVRLQDVIQEAVKSGNTTFVIKLDVELFECKVILGSKDIFNWNIFIPYIFMEWRYNDVDEATSEAFTKKELDELVWFLVSKSYTPYHMGTLKALPTNAWSQWKVSDIVWVQARAKQPFKTTSI